ncbi:MAG: EAL domain-containing protein [Ferrimicrobium acidiphilum]
MPNHSALAHKQSEPLVATLALQAIVDIETRSAVAHELLVRDIASRTSGAVRVMERLNDAGRRRLAVEAIGYARTFQHRQMHVNIDLDDLDVLDQIEDLTNVTVEIVEGNRNLNRLTRTIDLIHTKGGLVAMDDLGSPAWPLNAPLDAEWDIIKLDQDVLGWSERRCADLKRAVGGRNICLEGIEVEKHLIVAEKVGATLLQGYAYGIPTILPVYPQIAFSDLELL